MLSCDKSAHFRGFVRRDFVREVLSKRYFVLLQIGIFLGRGFLPREFCLGCILSVWDDVLGYYVLGLVADGRCHSYKGISGFCPREFCLRGFVWGICSTTKWHILRGGGFVWGNYVWVDFVWGYFILGLLTDGCVTHVTAASQAAAYDADDALSSLV